MKEGLELKQKMSSGNEVSETMVVVEVGRQRQTAGLPGLPMEFQLVNVFQDVVFGVTCQSLPLLCGWLSQKNEKLTLFSIHLW